VLLRSVKRCERLEATRKPLRVLAYRYLYFTIHQVPLHVMVIKLNTCPFVIMERCWQHHPPSALRRYLPSYLDPTVPASRLCDVTFSLFHPHSIHQDMPPRPFPYALNIGTDIVHVPRIRAIIAQGEGVVRKDSIHRFLRRLLTAREQELFWKKQKGISLMLGAHLEDTAKWLAGRYERRSFATVSRELLLEKPSETLSLPPHSYA